MTASASAWDGYVGFGSDIGGYRRVGARRAVAATRCRCDADFG
jgi:hypothetical protein